MNFAPDPHEDNRHRLRQERKIFAVLVKTGFRLRRLKFQQPASIRRPSRYFKLRLETGVFINPALSINS
jgi:hypothetical protein